MLRKAVMLRTCLKPRKRFMPPVRAVAVTLLVALAAIAPFSLQAGAKEATVDPLRRRDPKIGGVEYSVHLGYHPNTSEQLALTEEGPALERTVAHELDADLSLRYAASRYLSIEATRSWGAQTSIVERSPVSGINGVESEVRRRDLGGTTSIGLSVKPWPDHRLEPSIRVRTDGDGSKLILSVSTISDPTVLSADLGFAAANAGTTALEATLGAGFVANDKVSLGASVFHRVVPGRAIPPTTLWSVRVGYAADPETGKEVSVSASLSSSGGRQLVGFGVSWQGGVLAW